MVTMMLRRLQINRLVPDFDASGRMAAAKEKTWTL
jgi:hypothetical protein